MTLLCALNDVKTYLGSTTTANDASLTALIANASDFIEQYCNRTFAQTVYTETRNGTGQDRLFLRNGPVTAVAGVTVDTQPVAAAPDAISYGYVFDDLAVYIRSGGYPCVFNKGVQNVTVVYTAGYSVVPPSVNQACVELVADKFAKSSRIDKRNETLGTQQTQGYDLSDMPARVKLALAPFVRWSAP